jgi:hypothetical protein
VYRLVLEAEDEDGLLRAGSRVPAGKYQRVDVDCGRLVVLSEEDWLPPAHDGHVAVYQRVDGVRWQPMCQKRPVMQMQRMVVTGATSVA